MNTMRYKIACNLKSTFKYPNDIDYYCFIFSDIIFLQNITITRYISKLNNLIERL